MALITYTSELSFHDSKGRVSSTRAEADLNPNDHDWDGLPDSWESYWFDDSAVDGNDDPDADGRNNFEELRRSSNPTVADSPPPADSDSRVLAHFRFDGGSAQDSSGNGHDGAISGAVGAPDRGDSPFGALAFDGIDDIVTVPHHDALNPETLTLAAWVYGSNPSGWARIIDKHRFEAKEGYTLDLNRDTGAFRFAFQGTDGNLHFFETDTVIADGVWQHIAVTYDRSEVRLYYNGQLEKTLAATAAIRPTDRDLTIGNGFDDNLFWPFAGRIDDVWLFGRALPATEIATLYSQGTPISIRLTQPSASGDYHPGDTLTLSWDSIGIEPSAAMAVSMKRASTRDLTAPDGANWFRFEAATANDGSQVITLPAGLIEADDWQFVVRAVASGALGRSEAFSYEVAGSPRHSISGFVRDAQGQGLTDIALCIDGNPNPNCDTRTDADGHYILGSINPLRNGVFGVEPEATAASGPQVFSPPLRSIRLAGDSASGVNFVAAPLATDAAPTIVITAPPDASVFNAQTLFGLRFRIDGLAEDTRPTEITAQLDDGAGIHRVVSGITALSGVYGAELNAPPVGDYSLTVAARVETPEGVVPIASAIDFSVVAASTRQVFSDYPLIDCRIAGKRLGNETGATLIAGTPSPLACTLTLPDGIGECPVDGMLTFRNLLVDDHSRSLAAPITAALAASGQDGRDCSYSGTVSLPLQPPGTALAAWLPSWKLSGPALYFHGGFANLLLPSRGIVVSEAINLRIDDQPAAVEASNLINQESRISLEVAVTDSNGQALTESEFGFHIEVNGVSAVDPERIQIEWLADVARYRIHIDGPGYDPDWPQGDDFTLNLWFSATETNGGHAILDLPLYWLPLSYAPSQELKRFVDEMNGTIASMFDITERGLLPATTELTHQMQDKALLEAAGNTRILDGIDTVQGCLGAALGTDKVPRLVTIAGKLTPLSGAAQNAIYSGLLGESFRQRMQELDWDYQQFLNRDVRDPVDAELYRITREIMRLSARVRPEQTELITAYTRRLNQIALSLDANIGHP